MGQDHVRRPMTAEPSPVPPAHARLSGLSLGSRIDWDWGTNFVRSYRSQARSDNATGSNLYNAINAADGMIDRFNLNTNARYIRLSIASGSFTNFHVRELAVSEA